MIKSVHHEKKKSEALILWTCGLLQPLTHSFYCLDVLSGFSDHKALCSLGTWPGLAHPSETSGGGEDPFNSSIVPFEQWRKWPQEKID